MNIKLKNIDELYKYTDIKEYITINEDRNIDMTNYKISNVSSNKPNYQLYTKNNGVVITLAYFLYLII